MEKVDMVNSLFHSTYAYCNWPYNMALKRLNSILKTKYIMCYNSLEENGLSSYSSHDGWQKDNEVSIGFHPDNKEYSEKYKKTPGLCIHDCFASAVYPPSFVLSSELLNEMEIEALDEGRLIHEIHVVGDISTDKYAKGITGRQQLTNELLFLKQYLCYKNNEIDAKELVNAINKISFVTCRVCETNLDWFLNKSIYIKEIKQKIENENGILTLNEEIREVLKENNSSLLLVDVEGNRILQPEEQIKEVNDLKTMAKKL